MQTKNKIQHSALKFIFFDILLDVLYWPAWWYSRGLLKTVKVCLKQIRDQYQQLALGVWIKNIFTPMFGQYDWQGRMISFFVRLIQIIFRTILLLIWIAIIFFLFLGWIIIPIYIGYQIIENIRYLIL